MSLSASTIDPVQLLDQRVVEAIRRAFPEAAGAEAMISPCKQAALGDFQSNAAMPLAKKLGKNPREVA